MENSLFVTYQAYGPIAWIFRPICLVILVLAVATIVFTAFRSRRNVKAGIAVKIQETDDEDRLAGFAFLVLAVAVFASAGGQALGWGKTAAQFPLVVAIPALFLGILALVQDARILRKSRVGADGAAVKLITNSVLLRDLPKASLLLASLMGVVGLTVLVGQAIAIPVFILAYLLVRGRTSWKIAVSYATISGLILYFMFGELIGILWYPSILIDYG